MPSGVYPIDPTRSCRHCERTQFDGDRRCFFCGGPGVLFVPKAARQAVLLEAAERLEKINWYSEAAKDMLDECVDVLHRMAEEQDG